MQQAEGVQHGPGVLGVHPGHHQQLHPVLVLVAGLATVVVVVLAEVLTHVSYLWYVMRVREFIGSPFKVINQVCGGNTAIMMILGAILAIIGFIIGSQILWIIGLILLVVGAILFFVGRSRSRPVGGRYYY